MASQSAQVGFAEIMRNVLGQLGEAKADPTADMQLIGILEQLIVAKLHQPPQIPGAMPNPLQQQGGPPNLRNQGPPPQALAAGMGAMGNPDEMRRVVGANANAA